MTALVTGASGQLGRLVAEALLDQIGSDELVLLTRDPERLKDLAGRGVVVRAADFDRPEQLVSAFQGGDRLLLISTDALGRRVRQHEVAIAAAKAAGIGHVVYTSLPNPSAANASLVAPEHRATEEILMASGLRWTVLRNALYSEHRIPEAVAAAKAGAFYSNFGSGSSAFVSRTDCAAAAAAVIANPDAHAGCIYDITGPALLDAIQLASLYGQAQSVRLEAVGVDDSTLVQAMVAGGLPSDVAQLLSSFGTAIREGQLDQLTTAVADLTGRQPQSVASVVIPAFAGVEAAR